jgi:hypothetical protein
VNWTDVSGKSWEAMDNCPGLEQRTERLSVVLDES